MSCLGLRGNEVELQLSSYNNDDSTEPVLEGKGGAISQIADEKPSLETDIRQR